MGSKGDPEAKRTRPPVCLEVQAQAGGFSLVEGEEQGRAVSGAGAGRHAGWGEEAEQGVQVRQCSRVVLALWTPFAAA